MGRPGEPTRTETDGLFDSRDVDPRYARLEAFKAQLFPERVCPKCGRVADSIIVTAGKRTSAWCYHGRENGRDAFDGVWFHFEVAEVE